MGGDAPKRGRGDRNDDLRPGRSRGQGKRAAETRPFATDAIARAEQVTRMVVTRKERPQMPQHEASPSRRTEAQKDVRHRMKRLVRHPPSCPSPRTKRPFAKSSSPRVTRSERARSGVTSYSAAISFAIS